MSMKMSVIVVSIATVLSLAMCANAAQIVHYWDFEGNDAATQIADKYGGLTGAAVGAPDIGVTYANTGMGNALNQTYGAYGNYVEAGVDGSEINFGTGDFAISFWYYDDSADEDSRQMRMMDSLATDGGIQLSTSTSTRNFRFDDNAGGSVLSKNINSAGLFPTDQWIHVVINMDRVNEIGYVYQNGAEDHSFDFTGLLSGDIVGTQALQLGVINNGGNKGSVQAGAIDDVAFYTGTLGTGEISGLAGKTLAPTAIPEPAAMLLLALGFAGISRRRSNH